jgi:hypothetical protein
VFHTGSFPPNSMNSGDVLLYGLTVKSKDSAGINLPNVTGDIGLVAVHTDDNALDGAFLRAASDISMAGVTAHRNGGDGVDGVAAMGECLLFNASAGGNKANGIVLTCHDTVDVFSLSLGDSPLLPLGEFPDSQFNGNTLVGLAATSTDGSVVLSNSLLLTGSDGPPVQANDNKALGLDLDGDEGVTLVGVRADRNASGIAVQSADSVVAIAVSANDNKTGTGFSAVTTTAGIDFPFPAVGLLVVSATASGNAALGFDLTDTMGNIAVLNSAAVKNQNDGVRLSPKPGGTSFVEGSVLCENTTGGLRQTVNASVAAEGNWWGSVTGPTHPGNPGGTGNAVIDGSNGGSGTVDFLPFIDTITPLVPSDASLKQATEVAFQFSGGNGTVFLGLPPLFSLFGGFIPPDPPFALTTDNGVLIDEDESAATVHTTVNAPQGVLRVRLKASALGPATLTLDGPCGLDAVATLTIGRLNGAPVLSLGALGALAALLALAGGRRLSRR